MKEMLSWGGYVFTSSRSPSLGMAIEERRKVPLVLVLSVYSIGSHSLTLPVALEQSLSFVGSFSS